MTLQELLKSLNLTEENIKAINQAVDVVIESKVTEKEKELNEVKGNLDKLTEELKPLKKEKRDKVISDALAKVSTDEKTLKLIKVGAGLLDEDDEASIIEKAEAFVKEYDLKPSKITPELVTKEIKPVEKTEIKKEYKFVNKDN